MEYVSHGVEYLLMEKEMITVTQFVSFVGENIGKDGEKSYFKY